MKRIALLAAAFLAAMPVWGQRSVTPHRATSSTRTSTTVIAVSPGVSAVSRANYFSITGGLSIAGISTNDSDIYADRAKGGFYAGFLGGFQLSASQPLYFETGLLYVEKGGRSSTGWNSSQDISYRLGYLEVPLVVRYSIDLDATFSIQPCAGFYLAEGVSGWIKDYDTRESWQTFDCGYFRRPDAGIRLGAKLSVGIVYAEAAFDIGLVNIDEDRFYRTRNYNLTIAIGVDIF